MHASGWPYGEWQKGAMRETETPANLGLWDRWRWRNVGQSKILAQARVYGRAVAIYSRELRQRKDERLYVSRR